MVHLIEDSPQPLIVSKLANCVTLISLYLACESIISDHMHIPLSLGIFDTEDEICVSQIATILSAEIVHQKWSPFDDGTDCTDECYSDTQ